MYSAYIDNFLNAKDAVRIAKEAKPAFHKFLEVCTWSTGAFRAFVLVCEEGEKRDNDQGIWNVIRCSLMFHVLVVNRVSLNACLQRAKSKCPGQEAEVLSPRGHTSTLWCRYELQQSKLVSLFNLTSAATPQQCMRENKEKQALGDLMIKPVQRIPRYELLVKVSHVPTAP